MKIVTSTKAAAWGRVFIFAYFPGCTAGLSVRATS
jgi:hypothetical protein